VSPLRPFGEKLAQSLDLRLLHRQFGLQSAAFALDLALAQHPASVARVDDDRLVFQGEVDTDRRAVPATVGLGEPGLLAATGETPCAHFVGPETPGLVDDQVFAHSGIGVASALPPIEVAIDLIGLLAQHLKDQEGWAIGRDDSRTALRIERAAVDEEIGVDAEEGAFGAAAAN